MTKKIALKGVLLAFVAFLLSFAYLGTASAYDLYELDNMVINGGMSDLPITDDWRTITGVQTVITEVSGQLKNTTATVNSSNGIKPYAPPTFTDGHEYYISFDMTAYRTHDVKVYIGGTATYNTLSQAVGGVKTKVHAVTTSTQTGSAFYIYDNGATSTGMSIGSAVYYDNIIVLDLTAQFGAGLEPSLSDFELLWLPDLDYFDTYQSFDSGSYYQIPTSSYTDLGDDLTGIDYKKSVIDTYGENIEISLYAYFFDTPLLSGITAAQYYYTVNNPEISWRDTSYSLDWSYSDYSDRVLWLDLDDDQTTILKRALFDRHIGSDFDTDYTDDEGYLKLDIEGTAVDNVKFYIVFSSVFDLRVDIESFLISFDTDTGENEFNINQELYIKCQDKYDQTLLPALFSLLGDYGTFIFTDFGSQYTDVQSFNIEFEFTSPEPDDPDLTQTIYLYELGAFSSSDVVIGIYDPELPLPFDPQVCDWYELGCQAKNGVNEFVAWFYEAFDIDGITASFTAFFDSFDQVINLLPDEIVIILAIVGSALVAIVIIVVVDRITGGRSG
jgi:hypothetical protein